MSTVSTPTAPGSSSTQEARYTLQVLKAELKEPLQKKSALYVEIKLPKEPTVLTSTVKSPKLEWNKKYDFTSLQTAIIRVKLNKREPFRSDVCLGEASIGVGELSTRCQGDQDCSLVLMASPRSGGSIGTLLVQLQIKVQTSRVPPDLTGSRQMVENIRSKLVETLSVEYPRRSHSPSALVTGEDPDGFEIQNRVRNQLDSLNSGKLETTLEVINAAAKIHPGVESSWKMVSSLHGALQKKPRMDSEVIEVFICMDHVLSFAEEVDKLKDKRKLFRNLIEQSLRLLDGCGTFILMYLNSNTRDRTHSALSRSSERKLGDYQTQLNRVAENLARIVNVHVAHRVEDNHEGIQVLAHRIEDNHKVMETLTHCVEDGHKTMEVLAHRFEDNHKVMETLERIEGKIPCARPPSSASFHPIIPPPPPDTFTGRSDYLKAMEARFELPKTSVEIGRQRRFVLYGTGGMGKTQVALKFLDENRERFTMKYIIDASSNESIAASFANIARDAGIPDANTNKVLDWLSKKIEDWILIFDNADNRDVKLRPYFPNCRHGNILITTRNAGYGSLAPSLEVSVLEELSAVVLLLRTAKLEDTKENKEVAGKIVGEFGHLALAIVQAGSYVHTERLTLHEYYERYERSRSSLLKSGPLNEELAYERPVYATWEISYEALSQFAKTMLDLCAFLYREGITEELWMRAVASDKAKRAMENEDDDSTAPKELLSLVRHLRLDEDDAYVHNVRFREIVRELRSYSLIQEPFHGSFSIHPLVHSWARERMKSSHGLEAQTNAAHLLYYSLLESIHDMHVDSNFTRTIIPHIESCGTPLRADIALEFAAVYAACGQVDGPQTRRLLTIELIQSEQLEVDNQSTFDSRNYLGQLYGWLHRYSEAAEILRTLTEEEKRVLGNDHPSTLLSMHSLAMIYRDQGRMNDAQELFTEVIEAQRRVFGNNHFATLVSMQHLALTYRDQGRLDDAQELFVEVIEGQTRVFGITHYATLICVHCLALTYRDQGRLDDAQKLFAAVIEARIQVLGDDHSDTLDSMHELALTHRDQGRLDDAQELFAEVIEARKRVLGNDHASTLNTMCELALTYRNQRRLDDAQELFAEVIEALKRVPGDDHTFTTYRDQGQLDNAQELFAEVIKVRKRVLGDDHASTLNSMHQLAYTYLDRGRLNDGQELLAEVFEGRKRVLGNDHASTLNTMHDLAVTYRDQGRLDDAQERFAEVIEARKRVFGDDHSDTLNSMHCLALTYRDQGRLDDAQELSIESYERLKRVFGLSDYRTIFSRDLLIDIYSQLGRLGDAGRLKALNRNNP